jgi:hypothetical protein
MPPPITRMDIPVASPRSMVIQLEVSIGVLARRLPWPQLAHLYSGNPWLSSAVVVRILYDVDAVVSDL